MKIVLSWEEFVREAISNLEESRNMSLSLPTFINARGQDVDVTTIGHPALVEFEVNA